MKMHSARVFGLALVATVLSTAAWAQIPMPDAKNFAGAISDQVRLSTAAKLQLRERGALYVVGETTSGQKVWVPASCQPLKGERVQLIDFEANAGGVRGSNSARVKVAEGQCQGGEGVVGTTYIDAVK